MIYTITFNPAVDLVMAAEKIMLGKLNRVQEQHFVAGGKGINIAVLMKEFDMNVTATGFAGGFTGDFIQNSLKQNEIASNFIEVKGTSRINVKMKAESETELNGPGPFVTEQEFKQLYNLFQEELTSEDTVFLAGNTANGLDESAYVSIAKLCNEKGTRFIVDSNKNLLTECLKYRPFLIKPNHHELGEIFNTTISNAADIKIYAKKIQDMGARNVLTSRGGEGSVLLTEEGTYYSSNVPEGRVVNSVGAGDSMLAGFMAEFLRTKDYEKSLKQGAAAGSATAFSTGIGKKELIDQLTSQIEVKELN